MYAARRTKPLYTTSRNSANDNVKPQNNAAKIVQQRWFLAEQPIYASNYIQRYFCINGLYFNNNNKKEIISLMAANKLNT